MPRINHFFHKAVVFRHFPGLNMGFSFSWVCQCYGHGMFLGLFAACVITRFTDELGLLQYRNMFLAAAPYFQHRLQSDDWAATHYQPAILSVSTVTNLVTAFTLAKVQKGASYPRRIVLSLLINLTVFTILAFSTILLVDVAVGTYFNFLMVMVFGASLATGINQNGVFAYVSGFGREEYTQAIMAGQGVAGVLPSIVQILTQLVTPGPSGDLDAPQGSAKSAFVYFITATLVSSSALLAFLYLVKQSSGRVSMLPTDDDGSILSEHVDRKTVGLWDLFKKLRWNALAVFSVYMITMMAPVYTVMIESVHNDAGRSLFFEPSVFIPLAFLTWNSGDLIGRMIVLVPHLSLAHRPLTLFISAACRLGFIPLYLFCNIHGRGAVVQSDFFYLFIVQLLFGITNGYLGSNCMMGTNYWVLPEEREPAGGFMSMMLVGGLTAGSLLSFLAAG